MRTQGFKLFIDPKTTVSDARSLTPPLWFVVCLSSSAGPFFKLKRGPVLFGIECYWHSLRPNPAVINSVACQTVWQRRRGDDENSNSHSHISLHRHKALHRLWFSISLHCNHVLDLWSEMRSWPLNPHKSNHIPSLVLNEVSWQQTRDRLIVERAVSWIGLKSLLITKKLPHNLTWPKPLKQ